MNGKGKESKTCKKRLNTKPFSKSKWKMRKKIANEKSKHEPKDKVHNEVTKASNGHKLPAYMLKEMQQGQVAA